MPVSKESNQNYPSNLPIFRQNITIFSLLWRATTILYFLNSHYYILSLHQSQLRLKGRCLDCFLTKHILTIHSSVVSSDFVQEVCDAGFSNFLKMQKFIFFKKTSTENLKHWFWFFKCTLLYFLFVLTLLDKSFLKSTLFSTLGWSIGEFKNGKRISSKTKGWCFYSVLL